MLIKSQIVKGEKILLSLYLIDVCYGILKFQVEKFLKWVNEPVDETSQESLSHNKMQDTCTSSDSEEQDMSLEKADDLVETRDPEPEKCQTISSASELEAEKSEGGSLVATVPANCSTEEIANSPCAETEGRDQRASLVFTLG